MAVKSAMAVHDLLVKERFVTDFIVVVFYYLAELRVDPLIVPSG
jgi:hypothetical protein